jgi:DedD protein
MPPPSSENDLKRRARRRLIGAVALTLLAVIVLPLLLEDEPPPASSLAVKMAVLPTAVEGDEPHPATEPEPVNSPALPAAAQPASPQPEATPPAPPQSAPPRTVAAPKPEESRPTPQPAPAKPAPLPVAKPAATPVPLAKPAVASETFVVQLAALSDSAKANALKTRAAKAGLPAYTDTVGNLTRVRVGPFASREAAVAAAVKLAGNGISGQVQVLVK